MKIYFESKTSSDFKSGKDFWKFYSSIVKTKKSKETNTISSIYDAVLKKDVSEPIDIANTFCNFFTNIEMPSNITEDESKAYVNAKFREYKNSGKLKTSSFSFNQINELSVLEAIEGLDSSSSCGNTLIPISVIKNSKKTLTPILTNFFNECCSTGTIPSDLKCAIAFPLFKKGDSSSCDNYRGISVLSPFAKIYERLLSWQIINYFTDNKLFSTAQHGFRANHSCETALQSILDKWFKAIEQKQSIISLFVDFKKAFDLVDSSLLLLKLFHYGFDNNSLKLLSNYFSDRTMGVRIGKVTSDKSKIKLGVPQGSILGPLLFIIFINDFGFEKDFFTILFADDTTLVDFDKSLQVAIDKFKVKFEILNDWINHNRLFINWSKTKFMIITKDLAKPSKINLAGFEVEVVSNFKLLGIIIDDKLTFNNQILALQKIVNKKLFALKKIFFLSFKIKLHFFKTFILPHFDYCASLYIYLTKTLLDKIVKLYNSCIFNLLKLDLSNKTENEQTILLQPLNLFTFFNRFLYRLAIFFYKILNGQILSDQKENLILNTNSHNLRGKNRDIFKESFCKTLKCSRRISIFLPKFCNKIIRHSFNLNFNEFKISFLGNLNNFSCIFKNIFY